MRNVSRDNRAVFTIRTLLASVLAAFQLVPESALAADKWFLLARHGECFPIKSLERKFPDLVNVATPESFIQFVQAKGLKVTSKALPVQAGSAVEVHVPEKELALVFATAEFCSKAGTR